MTLGQSLVGPIAGGVIAIIAGLATSLAQFRLTRAIRREQYQREDRYRLYEKRVEVYSAFNVAAVSMREVLTSGDVEDHKFTTRNELFKKYVPILLLGASQVRYSASRLIRATDAVVIGEATFDAKAWYEAIELVREACRRDLLRAADEEEGTV